VRGRKLPSFQPPVYNNNIHTHKKHQTKVKFEKNNMSFKKLVRNKY
jgi:hypothetical protein